MEALGRVELPTNGLGNRCSIHLSYRAARRNRLVLLQFTATDGRGASGSVAQSLPNRGIIFEQCHRCLRVS